MDELRPADVEIVRYAEVSRAKLETYLARRALPAFLVGWARHVWRWVTLG